MNSENELVEKIAKAMFNWQVEPWQRMRYEDETLRTTKYRELAKVAIKEIKEYLNENN